MKIKTLVCCVHKTLNATQRGGANKLKKLPKKLLASLVAMLVIIVSMPLTVWADTKEWNCGASETDTPSNLVKAKLYTSQTTVDGKTYEAGTMVISGTGAMHDWYSPWDDYKELIKTLIVEDGVAKIGDSAFDKCIELTTVDLSSCTNLETIGLLAFFQCSELKSVTLPNSVTKIGDSAFDNCIELTTVDLSSCTNLETIGSLAFFQCYELKSVTLPNSVTKIGHHAFCECTRLESIAIPDSVTEIGENTFNNCQALGSITIPCNKRSLFNGNNKGITLLENDPENYDYSVNVTNPIKKGNFTYVPGTHVSLSYENAENPTCEVPGHVAGYTCSNCGKHYSDNVGSNEIPEGSWIIKAFGHEWGAWEAVDGENHKRTCRRDASHVETGEHAWKETARTDSEVTYTCEVCDATKAEKITPVDPDNPDDPDNPENENSTEEAAQTSANSSWKHDKSLAIQTGDSNVGLYIIFSFVLVSAAAMVFITFNRKRKVK